MPCRTFGYDGLELRLLDGEPIDVLEIAPSTRRAVAAALAATPLVCLDTSIELAGAFERALPAAIELAREWGTDMIRVFGGDVRDLDDVARRLEPLLQEDVTVALETHDHFASADAGRRTRPDRLQPVIRCDLGPAPSDARRRVADGRRTRARLGRPARAREGRAAAGRRLGARAARRGRGAGA